MKWVCFPKFYNPLANRPLLRISPQSSLYVIYCLILTAWQWLMSFTCIPVQIEPNKSPLRKRLLALLLWEVGHLSSPSRSCIGRLILICVRQGSSVGGAPPQIYNYGIIIKKNYQPVSAMLRISEDLGGPGASGTRWWRQCYLKGKVFKEHLKLTSCSCLITWAKVIFFQKFLGYQNSGVPMCTSKSIC